MSHSTTLHNPQALPRRANLPLPLYNPILNRRRCARCGRTDAWRRWVWDSNPGGWYCCSPIEAIRRPGEMMHICSTLCGLGGAA